MLNIKSHAGMSSRFTLTVRKAWSPDLIVGIYEAPNLITNSGLDYFHGMAYGAPGGAPVYPGYIFVGASNSTPVYTDTQMGSLVASAKTPNNQPFGSNPSAPLYQTVGSATARFSAGIAAGNLSEVGFGWQWGNDPATWHRVFSRALILDSIGNPTTITILPDEILDVTYHRTFYPDLSDHTGTITINGISYNYTQRAINVTQNAFGNSTMLNSNLRLQSQIQSYTGGLAAITAAAPTGSSGTATDNITYDAYVPGSYIRSGFTTASDSQLNASGGIKTLVFSWGGSLSDNAFRFSSQVTFDPVIPKTNLSTMKIFHSLGVSRR